MNSSPTLNSTLKGIQPIEVNNEPFNTKLALLQVGIVDGCQLRCVGCPNSLLIRKPSFMPPDLFRDCVNNIDVEFIDTIRLFTYGEPLLHPKLDMFGTIVRNAPFVYKIMELSTNAQTKSFKPLEAMVSSGALNRLAISCDGDGTPESYEALRPPAKWDSLLGFLEFASQLARTHTSLELIARSIINHPEDAQRWRSILEPYGIKPEFRGWKYLPESKDNMTGRKLQFGKGVCWQVADTTALYVNHKGDVLPCCVHPQAAILGNLAESTYSSIVRGRTRSAFMEEMEAQRSRMQVCNMCEYGPSDNPGPSTGRGLNFDI